MTVRVDDCDRSEPAEVPFPESGRFVNPKFKRTVTQRVYRFLERVRFVVPVTRERDKPGGRPLR